MKRMTKKAVMTGVLASIFLMLQAGLAFSDMLVSQNLGSSHYTASSIQAPTPSYLPMLAFDGNTGTRWQANSYVTTSSNPQWIEVDLGSVYILSDVHIVLQALAAPGVSAIFDVYASKNPMQGSVAGATLIHEFAPGPFVTGQILEYDIPDNVVYAQFLQIRTLRDLRWNTTNGYVRPSFREIEVYADDSVPEPSTLLLVGAGLGGFALLRRRARR